MSGQPSTGGQSADSVQEASTSRPTLRVVRGNPTPEDIAALVAILAAASGGAEGPYPASRLFGWASRVPRMRTAHPRGPGAWRAGSIPR